MATDREIEEFRKDPVRWRATMRRLHSHHYEALSDEALDMIERLLPLKHVAEISYRQAEWLLNLEESVKLVTTYRGFSLKTLIRVCFENRFDLPDSMQLWIETLFNSQRMPIRHAEAKRVYDLARRLGEVESWAA